MAILFSALAPTVSHALAYAGAASAQMDQMEICTVDGSKMISVSDAPGAKMPSDSLLHHLDHCPYCNTHAASPALLPPAGLSFAVIGGHDLFPSLFYDAPAPLFSWSSSNPRAPPLSA